MGRGAGRGGWVVGLSLPHPPRRNRVSTAAHTWRFFLSALGESEFGCFVGDFVICLFSENFKAKKVSIEVYAVPM